MYNVAIAIGSEKITNQISEDQTPPGRRAQHFYGCICHGRPLAYEQIRDYPAATGRSLCQESPAWITQSAGAVSAGYDCRSGEQPVNTSGGLECRGRPVGASGLAENGGGNIGVEEAAMCIHILEKVK